MIGLEYIRKLYGDTITSLGEKLNISNVNVSQWENQKKSIPEKRLEELSKLYNIPKGYFSKELTKLEKLKIEHKKLSQEFNDSIIEYETPIAFDKNNHPIEFETHTEGRIDLAAHIRIIESEIKTEKLIQEIYDIIDNSYSAREVCINTNVFIDEREYNIQLIHKFISLMKSNTGLFLAYILRAVELSNDDSWGKNPRLDRNDLTGKVLAVIREWKDTEKKRCEAEYQEYKELFGLDED